MSQSIINNQSIRKSVTLTLKLVQTKNLNIYIASSVKCCSTSTMMYLIQIHMFTTSSIVL